VQNASKPRFLRYCLENRGYAIRPLMAKRLLAAAVALWQQPGKFHGDLPAHSMSC
jgi:hypothetical protein